MFSKGFLHAAHMMMHLKLQKKKKGSLPSSPAGFDEFDKKDRKQLLCEEQRCLVCMYDGNKGVVVGGGRPGGRGKGSVLALLSFAISCFNCSTRAGSRINDDLRVMQIVSPEGCGTPVMRILLSFPTLRKPAKLMTSIPSAKYQMQFKIQAKPPVNAERFFFCS